ncbi:MAG: hypothetical protein D6735_01175 [Acidobacteria bacterium]|jgi:hypothetical protein|nr:MAG: hypothetical protein D6735_01175 [Acidobacteriota bacterium]
MRIRLNSDPQEGEDFISLQEANKRLRNYFTLGDAFRGVSHNPDFAVYYWHDKRSIRYYVKVSDLEALINKHLTPEQRALVDSMPDWIRAKGDALMGLYVGRAFGMFAKEHGVSDTDRVLRGSFILAARRVDAPVLFFADLVEYYASSVVHTPVEEDAKRFGVPELTIMTARSRGYKRRAARLKERQT